MHQFNEFGRLRDSAWKCIVSIPQVILAKKEGKMTKVLEWPGFEFTPRGLSHLQFWDFRHQAGKRWKQLLARLTAALKPGWMRRCLFLLSSMKNSKSE